MSVWSWRLALNHGFWDRDGQPTFHAHDVNNHAACSADFGLVQSSAQPNEGSHFCPDCLDVTRAQPEGRAVRVYAGTRPKEATG